METYRESVTQVLPCQQQQQRWRLPKALKMYSGDTKKLPGAHTAAIGPWQPSLPQLPCTFFLSATPDEAVPVSLSLVVQYPESRLVYTSALATHVASKRK